MLIVSNESILQVSARSDELDQPHITFLLQPEEKEVRTKTEPLQSLLVGD